MQNINIDYLLDMVISYYDSETDYHYSSKKYLDKHGHGVFFYNGKELTKEEQHIDYAYHYNNEMRSVVDSMETVLSMDREKIERLHIAAKAARKWYVKTKWERLIPLGMQDQFEKFIFG